jgi:predicted GTPase
VYRQDAGTEVVAFTATQIPGIDGRVYPPVLAGPRYPLGIEIRSEVELTAIVKAENVDEVVLAYSDLSYGEVRRRSPTSRIVPTSRIQGTASSVRSTRR